MQAFMNTDDGIRVVDADEPGGAGVRLSVVSAGICGTDVTHRYPIDDAQEAFRVAAERNAGAIKVVIEP